MHEVMLKTELEGLKLFFRGKVRDIYEVDGNLLIVSTDRISAFDVVMPNGIPDKGKILNLMSIWWFDRMRDVIDNHIISGDPDGFPEEVKRFENVIKDRAVYVRKAEPLKVECVVRGYLAGSGWKDYKKTGEICGIKLAPGLKESEKLSEPLFTPATKAEKGMHDENISFEKAKDIVGSDLAERMRDISLTIYKRAHDYAYEKGIIIADTKMEFGLIDGRLILIDELLTPDSSRFWPLDEYEPGRPQKSFDKQFVRDYLENTGWDKSPPAPLLPADIVKRTREKYLEALKRLTGIEI